MEGCSTFPEASTLREFYHQRCSRCILSPSQLGSEYLGLKLIWKSDLTRKQIKMPSTQMSFLHHVGRSDPTFSPLTRTQRPATLHSSVNLFVTSCHSVSLSCHHLVFLFTVAPTTAIISSVLGWRTTQTYLYMHILLLFREDFHSHAVWPNREPVIRAQVEFDQLSVAISHF